MENIFPLISILSFLGVVFLFAYVFDDRKNKKRRPTSHEKEISRYFVNMRWFGFHDDDIADMLHSFKDHSSLKQSNRKAEREINKKS